MIEIERSQTLVTITAASSAATTTPRFPFGRFAGGGVFIASTGGATQINWHAGSAAEDLVRPIFADGAAVTTAVTVGCHPVPDACFSFPYVAPVLVGGASAVLAVSLKG
jgi:hypothetical protein